MILLKKLGAEIEEQIAGLLHDVSHTPFSHVIDSVIGDPTKEDYQDKIYEEFLKKSEIPKILKKYNFDINLFLNHKNFKLLEKEAPSLCADRIDYCLRQLRMRDGKNLTDKILNNLFVREAQIVFRDEKFANIFGQEYASLQREEWGGEESMSRYYILSEILKKALKNNLISLADFEKTEKPILRILNNSKDKFILKNLNTLKKGFKIIDDKNGIELKKKFRYVDPEILIGNSYKRLSEISPEYLKFIQSEKKESCLIKKVKIISN
jgi:hypothetical protein